MNNNLYFCVKCDDGVNRSKVGIENHLRMKHGMRRPNVENDLRLELIEFFEFRGQKYFGVKLQGAALYV